MRRLLCAVLLLCLAVLAAPPAQAAEECVPLTDNSDRVCVETRGVEVCYYKYRTDPDPFCVGPLT